MIKKTITGLFLLCVNIAFAATTVSSGIVSGAWNDASRWSAGIPSASDDAIAAAPSGNVALQISNWSAEAKSLVLSNANANSSIQLLNGGSLTLYGNDQIAGHGAVSGGKGSIRVSQTNQAAAGSVLNASAINVFSLTISANNGTACLAISSNQNFIAVNAGLGNGNAAAGGSLELNGGSLSLVQWFSLGHDGTDSGAFDFNGGTLTARFGIRAGVTAAAGSSEFIFNDGTISSSNRASSIQGYSPGFLDIQLAGTGHHEFYAAAGASITVQSSARLIDQPGEAGTLLKTGPAVLNLNGANSYSGGTTVEKGNLSVNADGGLGAGNIQIESGSLFLGGGEMNNYINDNARLILSGEMSGLYLGFEGTDTVAAVSLDGGTSWLSPGVYSASALSDFGSGFYYGSGYLSVTSAPGPVAVLANDSNLWDMTSLRTNPVTATVLSSSSAGNGYIQEEDHLYVPNTAGTTDRYYCCVIKPENSGGPLPLIFMLHGGGGHAGFSLANVPLNNLPAGQQAISVAVDYSVNSASDPQALYTVYGDPVPQSYSEAADVNEEIVYRNLMGFRRILDYLLEQENIDTNRIAVFGTSWGGFRTMLWAGLDDRLAVAAASPGGGGMRGSNSAIGSQVAAIPEPMRERWYSEFDPLSHAADVKARVFLEAPANDWYFWVGGIQQNLQAVPSDKRWLVIPNNTHGLGAPDSANLNDSMPFIMNTLFGGPTWPEIDDDSVNASGLTYEWQVTNGVADSAVLNFSPGDTNTDWPSRYWVKIPAALNNGEWSATLPDRFFEVAGKVFVTVADTNGFHSSSLIQSRGGRDPLSVQCSLWTNGAVWDVASQENSWRPINLNDALIEKGTASGSVGFTPVKDGALSVCNNSVIMAAPYAYSRQGLKLVLNGNGLAGSLEIELLKKSQVPGGETYTAPVTVGTNDTEITLPWSSFIPQNTAEGNPYPFDGLAITGVRAGNVPVTFTSLDFYAAETAVGVPYWWLIENGFSGDMDAAALSDPDADGQPTWKEYFSGTDPFDPASALKISIAMKPGKTALLAWTPVQPGRNYTVESTADLQNGFSAETPRMDYPSAAYTTAVTSARRFYKVTVDYTGAVQSAGSYLPPGVAAVSVSNAVHLVRYDTDGNLVSLRAFGVNYYDAFSRYMENVTNRSFVAGFDYLEAHDIPVARIFLNGYGPVGWSLYFSDKAEYYRRLDDFIAQAEQHGIGLLMDLFGGVNQIGELVNDAVTAGYLTPGVDFTSPSPLNRDIYGVATYAEYRTALSRQDSGSNAFITYFTRELLARYKNSPAVWGWEFANEANNAVDLPNIQNFRPQSNPALGYFLQRDDSSVPAWTSKDDITRDELKVAKIVFARSVRTVDSWRFISSGDSRPRQSAYHNWKDHSWTVDTKAEIAQVIPMDSPAPMNTVSFHIYQPTDPYFSDDPVSLAPVTGDYQAFLAFFKSQCDLLGQPMFIGEWGAAGDGTTEAEKTTFNRFMQAVIDTGIQLSFLWDFDNRNIGQTNDFRVNPGTDKEYQLTNDDPALWDLQQANQLYGVW